MSQNAPDGVAAPMQRRSSQAIGTTPATAAGRSSAELAASGAMS